ncbi:hypothetical protein [Aurantiacibacter gangjinensis]|uniref:Uncharacterized protein n=1 Tax=Aurantiacibacter gangjinensis TaxID=502682 RepID=A0A0G9MN97_9SPHN|nr:hypothetical protein [Aurantiacibacter gangjinensis]APE27351.1 hypothetical protein BMF35_a0522 [Aurantiacibacter gangjinensis]KLE32172.1 hypothetical protein AAW01_07590 [Aurantiacibacter gangjinensis]
MKKARTSLAGKVTLGASAALLAVALPAAGLAFTSGANSALVEDSDGLVAFTPANADPRLARLVAERGGDAGMMRFTPAASASSTQPRSITVAVRVDRTLADVLSGRSVGAESTVTSRPTPLRVTPTRFNLGLARGYGSFAQEEAPAARSVTPQLSGTLSRANIPDLADLARPSARRDEPGRFGARIALDEGRDRDATVSGETVSDQLLDIGGSYSLTRNFDITAGVRYEQDRDLVPVPNLDQQDSQAVYVGTQFRF